MQHVHNASNMLDFSLLSIWIRIIGLPLIDLNKKNAKLMDSLFLKILKIDQVGLMGGARKGFLRIKVLVDVNDSIFLSFWIVMRK